MRKVFQHQLNTVLSEFNMRNLSISLHTEVVPIEMSSFGQTSKMRLVDFSKITNKFSVESVHSVIRGEYPISQSSSPSGMHRDQWNSEVTFSVSCISSGPQVDVDASLIEYLASIADLMVLIKNASPPKKSPDMTAKSFDRTPKSETQAYFDLKNYNFHIELVLKSGCVSLHQITQNSQVQLPKPAELHLPAITLTCMSDCKSESTCTEDEVDPEDYIVLINIQFIDLRLSPHLVDIVHQFKVLTRF